MTQQTYLKLLISIVILASALWMRLPRSEGGLTLDEAEYTLAAQEGIVANHFDSGSTRYQRHFHGPVLSYLITTQLHFWGDSEESVRFPSRLAGALTCLVLFWGCLLCWPHGLHVGTLAGLLLAFMPIHIQVSMLANMHATALLLVVSIFFVTLKMVSRSHPGYLYVNAMLLAILFATIEYGFIVTAILGVVLVLTPNAHLGIRNRRLYISRHLWGAIAVLIVTLTLVWSAGVLKLNVLKNLYYYLQYSAHGHPIKLLGTVYYHLPWWSYIYWYYAIIPVFLIATLISLVIAGVRAVATRFEVRYRVFWIFMIVLLAALFRQHIMSARYSVYIIPFLCMAFAFSLVYLKRRLPAPAGWTVLLLALVLTGVDYAHSIDRSLRGDPGYKQAARYLRQHAAPQQRILAWYKPVLQFYLPEFDRIENYNSGHIDSLVFERIQTGYYSYVLYYHNQINRWPQDPGYLYVKSNHQPVYTYCDDESCFLWLYSTASSDTMDWVQTGNTD